MYWISVGFIVGILGHMIELNIGTPLKMFDNVLMKFS